MFSYTEILTGLNKACDVEQWITILSLRGALNAIMGILLNLTDNKHLIINQDSKLPRAGVYP